MRIERGFILLGAALLLGVLSLLALSLSQSITESSRRVVRYRDTRRSELEAFKRARVTIEETGFKCSNVGFRYITRRLCIESLKFGVRVPRIETDSCNNSVLQRSGSTLKGTELSSGSIISKRTCIEAGAPIILNRNLSVHSHTADLSNSEILVIGYIEIGELVINNRFSIIAGGDIYLDRIVCTENCRADIISTKGSVIVREISGEIKIRADSDNLLSIPPEAFESGRPSVPSPLPGIVYALGAV